MPRFAVILPAAGRSTRFGDPKQKKIYADLDGRAVWLRAVEPFVNRDDVGQILLAIAPEDRELFERRYRPNVAFLNIKVLEGGPERADSIANALEAADPSCDFVAVHDAARPCLTGELVDAVFSAAVAHGAAILAVPVADTVKRADADGVIVETVSRSGLHCAQTPQVFRR
ncbi:MAG TPA: IspD/TarI family cytidylyltransferase, partial [Isosphaeraceae bacterium]